MNKPSGITTEETAPEVPALSLVVAAEETETEGAEPIFSAPIQARVIEKAREVVRQRTIFDETGELPPMRGGTIAEERTIGGLFG